MPRVDSCEDCLCFFVPAEATAEQTQAGFGLCRRNPPQMLKMDGGPTAFFPVMHKSGWCYEHKEIPEGYLSATKGN
jgi:hypothetical protein